MKHFLSIKDVTDLPELISSGITAKKDPFADQTLGKNKTIGLLFFNSSLRTRISTQKAAQNLGLNVITMNVGQDGWGLEMEEGVIMNGDKAEHVKEAAAARDGANSTSAINIKPHNRAMSTSQQSNSGDPCQKSGRGRRFRSRSAGLQVRHQ